MSAIAQAQRALIAKHLGHPNLDCALDLIEERAEADAAERLSAGLADGGRVLLSQPIEGDTFLRALVAEIANGGLLKDAAVRQIRDDEDADGFDHPGA